jgi:hypothetical protein
MDDYIPTEEEYNRPALNIGDAALDALLDLRAAAGAETPVLPPHLTERILAADALILLSTPPEGGLTMQAVAFGTFRPGQVATHAYVNAHEQEYPNILARVKGEPTDAQRYQALRAFACLAGTDVARFKRVNDMLQQFEEANMADDPAERIGIDHDRMAEFLIHALLETTPLVVEQRQPNAH